MPNRRLSRRVSTAGLVAASAVALVACGSNNNGKSSASNSSGTAGTRLSVSITEHGKTAKYTAPASVKGGLVTLTLANNGKRPHAAQLVRVIGNHPPQQVLKTIGGNSPKTPAWIRGEGGLGPVPPGQTGTAALNLAAGKYLVVDTGGPGGPQGPPAFNQLTVTSGTPGTLPSTQATVTAAQTGKDRYKWNISGTLKPGSDTVTFQSKGSKAIHLIAAVRLKKNVSKQQIIKALAKQGKPPAFVDSKSIYTTAVLDGGKAQTTPLQLSGPGRYVLFCPLPDRDGGKPHFLEGLVTTVNVK